MTIGADVIVVGVGSVGSMASRHLAGLGYRVVGIDRSTVPSPFSGYAGESRLFRMIYREGAHYMPILIRAREMWQELERESGRSLLTTTGGVTIGKAGNRLFEQVLQSGREQDLKFDLLSGAEASKFLPLHALHADSLALFDPDSGYLLSEQAVLAAVISARNAGAKFLENRTIASIEHSGNNWKVRTQEETVSAPRIIIATGTGAGPFSRSLGAFLTLKPQVLAWFPLRDPHKDEEQSRQVFLRYEEETHFYGFPTIDGWTAKVAASVYLDEVQTYEHPIEVHPAYLDPVISCVREYLPGLEPRPIRTAICADGHVPGSTALLGPVNGLEGLVCAVGFSGHGFKMAPALGAISAELAMDGVSQTDVSFMDPNRFKATDALLDEVVLRENPAQ